MGKSKKLAIYRNGDKVYAAAMENNRVTGSLCETMPVQLVTDDSVVDALKKIVSESKVKETAVVMVLPDNDCVSKTVDAKNMNENEFKLNLPFEFREFVPRGSEDEYVYDYQTLPDKDKALALAVAAPRVSILRMQEIASDAGFELVRLIPESAAYGDMLRVYGRGDKTTVIVECGTEKITVLVFNGGVCVGTNEIQDGLGSVDVMRYNSFASVFEDRVVDETQLELLDEYSDTFDRLAPKILRAIRFYNEKGVITDGTPVFMAFEGALMKPFLDRLEQDGNRTFTSIRTLIPGDINPVHAAMMAPVIGAGLVIR